MGVFKLGQRTIARCRVCGASVFADDHVVKAGGRVTHAECVLHRRRPPSRPARAPASADSA